MYQLDCGDVEGDGDRGERDGRDGRHGDHGDDLRDGRRGDPYVCDDGHHGGDFADCHGDFPDHHGDRHRDVSGPGEEKCPLRYRGDPSSSCFGVVIWIGLVSCGQRIRCDDDGDGGVGDHDARDGDALDGSGDALPSIFCIAIF